MKTEGILILIFTLINLSFCEEPCTYSNPSKKSDCTSRTLSSSEKSNGADACCYVTYKNSNNQEQKECSPEVKKLITKDTVKEMEDDETKDLSIECNSKWLNFNMLFIVLFALLF